MLIVEIDEYTILSWFILARLVPEEGELLSVLWIALGGDQKYLAAHPPPAPSCQGRGNRINNQGLGFESQGLGNFRNFEQS